MNSKIFALPLLAAAVFASPALAQDADEADGFSGVYVGVSGGYAAPQGSQKSNPVQFDTNRDGNYTENVNTSTGANAFSPGFCPGQGSGATQNCNGDDNAVEYAGKIGFDLQSGSIVYGALIEGSKSNAVDYASAYSTTPAGYHFSRELDYAISARARLGFTPDNRVLMYATGGGSYAKINHGFTTTNTANTFTPNNDGEMVWGWQAGGGAEVKLARNFTVGLEYLYNRYDDDKYYVGVGQGTAAATNPFLLNGGGTNMRQDPRFDFHSVRATMGLRF